MTTQGIERIVFDVIWKGCGVNVADKAEMLRLVKLRDSMQAEELMDAIAKSKYSIGDVIKMVKGKKQNPEEE